MDRRKALKNIGMSLGYTVTAPTLISLMQSCKTETILEWTPDFFSKEEGSVLTHLVDIILPKTDTPSATEVQVNIFVDRFANEVMEKQQQDFIKMAFRKFTDKALEASGKEKVGNLSPDDLEPVLANALKVSKEQEKFNKEVITEYMEAIEDSNTSSNNITDEIARYAFANHIRGLTIMGYKASEYVGEKVLAYLPVPGEYKGCADVQELTGGKAWSL